MIAEYIKTLLPKEWPTVIGDLPATSNEVIGIMEYDGASSIEYFGDAASSTLYKPIVKIVARCGKYTTGKQWVDTARKILHRYHDDHLLSVLVVGTPIYLGRGPSKLHEFQVTFQIRTRE